MKSALPVLLLGLVGFPGSVPVHGEARLEPPGERRHLGFVLAQGPSGEPQPVLPGYTRDQGAFDGEIAAEFKGTRWWWLSGYVCGFSIVGLLFVDDVLVPRDASISRKEYEDIRGKGIEYVQGYREAYGRHVRKKRTARHNHGSFWGFVTVLGVFSVKTTLALID